MDLGIDDKVALVMGASVALASRSRETIEAAAGEIAARHGAVAEGFVADAGDVDSLPGLVQEVERSLGPVDVLVTNTGGPPFGDPLDFDQATWEAAYRSLVLAPMALIEAVVPGMRERGWGRIVNVTSTSTREPMPGLMLSNSHRLAAVGAFKTLSDELARDGVLLNSVAPGRIATQRIAELTGRPLEELASEPQPDIPVGRLGTIEEMGDVVAFLCSERASYVNGVNLVVDGGRVRSVQ
jgi:3-oxoacyl-[acyl-carrier protein] reductase